MMSDLPVERLGYRHQQFSNCGVDYFGLIRVTIHRSKKKKMGFSVNLQD